MAIEILAQFLEPSLTNPIVVAIGVGLVRSVAGFLEHTGRRWKSNGRIEGFSGKKLWETIWRVLPQELGLSAILGVPGASLATDWIIKTAKKK